MMPPPYPPLIETLPYYSHHMVTPLAPALDHKANSCQIKSTVPPSFLMSLRPKTLPLRCFQRFQQIDMTTESKPLLSLFRDMLPRILPPIIYGGMACRAKICIDVHFEKAAMPHLPRKHTLHRDMINRILLLLAKVAWRSLVL